MHHVKHKYADSFLHFTSHRNRTHKRGQWCLWQQEKLPATLFSFAYSFYLLAVSNTFKWHFLVLFSRAVWRFCNFTQDFITSRNRVISYTLITSGHTGALSFPWWRCHFFKKRLIFCFQVGASLSEENRRTCVILRLRVGNEFRGSLSFSFPSVVMFVSSPQFVFLTLL